MPIPEHDWIKRYLQYTQNTEPPTLYKEWVAVSTIASVLQRKYKLTWGTITFYPNMYVVLVGPPGRCKKGVAMGFGQNMLRSIGIKISAESVTREALIRDLAESTSHYENTTSGKQMIHSSLTVISKELAVFLGYENKTLMSDLTDWYDCDDKWTYRTKGSGTDEIVGVWLNLIGATTPQLVQSQLPRDAVGGGLSSRIIFVYEDNKEKSVAAPFLSTEEKKMEKKLEEDLEEMYQLKGEVVYDESFLEEYVRWYEQGITLPDEYGGRKSAGVRSDFMTGPLSYYNERRANHVMRLCIVMSASQRQPALDKHVLYRAIDLLERTEVKMPKAFGGYGTAVRSEVIHEVLTVVEERKEISRSEILRSLQYDFDEVSQFDGIVGLLRASGQVKVAYTGNDIILRWNG